jgi:hypothetical protein
LGRGIVHVIEGLNGERVGILRAPPDCDFRSAPATPDGVLVATEAIVEFIVGKDAVPRIIVNVGVLVVRQWVLSAFIKDLQRKANSLSREWETPPPLFCWPCRR